MAGQTGLTISGDDEDNKLIVKVVHEENGGLSVYNVIHAAGGDDKLSGRLETTDGEIIGQFGTQLFGEDGNDTIIDSGVADTLSGGGGDDTIYSAYGRDTIDGGDGFDTLVGDWFYPTLDDYKITGVEELLLPGGEVYVGKFDLNTIDVIGPNDKQYARALYFSKTADVTNVTFIGQHGWSLIGSRFDDLIDVSTSSVKFNLAGESGDDTITGGGSNDDLTGETGNDSLAGGSGNDFLFGDNGDDTLSGGDGNDHIFTAAGDDVVDGGDGDDIISGAMGTSGGWPTREKDFKIIEGGAGDDIIKDFRLYDQTASHYLGGEGTDEIILGWDISRLTLKDIEILHVERRANSITADADVLNGFEQIIGIQQKHFEFIFSSGGYFTWHAASQEPRFGKIIGSDHVDNIDMSASSSIWTVLTGDGNDTLKAGKGYCTLSGQGGRDTFIFDDHTGRTEIADYDSSGADRDIIDLSAVSAIKNFKDMIENHVKVTGEGDWLTIDLGKGDIELYHVGIKDLDEKGFIF